MAVTLDHAYYPHIIDLVLGYATLQSLSRLRVCRDWKKRVEQQLYQVRLSELPSKPDSPSAISYTLDGGVPGEPVIFKITPEWYDNPILPSYLGGTSVIDIDLNELNDGVMAILSSARPDATYRFLNHTQMRDAAPHDSSVVLFDKDICPRRVEEHFGFGLSNVQNGSKLVLHVRRGGRNWLDPADYEVFANFKQLTIIMHPNAAHDDDDPAPLASGFGRYGEFSLGVLIGLGFIGYTSGLPTMFVSYGLDVEEQIVLDERSIKEQIFTDIMWEHHAAVQRGRIGRTRALASAPLSSRPRTSIARKLVKSSLRSRWTRVFFAAPATASSTEHGLIAEPRTSLLLCTPRLVLCSCTTRSRLKSGQE